jgi:hypothetical protein
VCGFRKGILGHVLIHSDFDEDDTAWLCTTISAFLFIVERSLWARETRIEHPTWRSCGLAQKAAPAAELYVMLSKSHRTKRT